MVVEHISVWLTYCGGRIQTDLTAANWALMSDGQEWKGDWSPNTTYKPK